MIRLRDVTKRFEGASYDAVSSLSLDVAEGETIVLVGPSGCGKTTTMKMINRLVEPTSGVIEVGGRNVLDQDPVVLRRGIGYVIQSVGLMPHRNVAENIATVPKLLRWDAGRVRSRVRELMELFELDEELLRRYPSELSGGQRQRVGVARALAADPPVMLMDEPFAAVDPVVRERLQDQFLDIQQRLRKTIVFVTHDIDEAIKMADRVAIFRKGGVIEQVGTPNDILADPANDFVAAFVGSGRGLKRLSLKTIADVGVQKAPVVPVGASVEEALAEMKRYALDWATVVEDGRLLGWVDSEMLDGRVSVADVTPRAFSTELTTPRSLRDALDAIVTSRTGVAVVVDDARRYLGIVTLGHVSQVVS